MKYIINKIANYYCKFRLKRELPNIILELSEYGKSSDTTGTQWITLWYAVSGILKFKPKFILESGTGASTIVLAAAVQKLMHQDPSYYGKIVSMESYEEWYQVAKDNLPPKYKDLVELVYGPREEFTFGMFRGLIHSNIPHYDYSFVFLDGPSFIDEKGMSFCADAFKIMEFSKADIINGVIDARRSSAFVMQLMFGPRAAPHFKPLFASRFSIPRVDLRKWTAKKDFTGNIFGGLKLSMFRSK